MTTWAVVPVKRFADSKCRLAGVLAPEARRQLSTAMLRDVLAALTATPGVDRIVLATSDPSAAVFGCPIIDDGAWVVDSPQFVVEAMPGSDARPEFTGSRFAGTMLR